MAERGRHCNPTLERVRMLYMTVFHLRAPAASNSLASASTFDLDLCRAIVSRVSLTFRADTEQLRL